MTGSGVESEWSLPLIHQLARAGHRVAEAGAVSGDLRPRQAMALKLLSERGALSQQVLGKLLSLDPSNVVGLLNGLEERGLTVRRRDPADRRRHIVELSAAGQAELEAVNSRIVKVDDEVLHALTPVERSELHRLLARAVGDQLDPCRGPHAEP
jgi:DNA-binding MarR family transcriptional regulator